ncbi:MAG: lipopolysaccharide kinase InaA family protein [Longimicrobiales bacterium]
MRLPAGYERGASLNAEFIAIAADHALVARAIESDGSLSRYAARQLGSRALPGRGTVHVMAANGTHWAVRHYQRGGAAAGILRDRYLAAKTPRPFAELLTSATARERGIATPRVTAAVTYDAGLFYRADIATSFVANAADLATLSLGARAWPMDERVAAWGAAGAMLHMCFDVGLVHPDLNLKNILIERTAAGAAAHVIDLDRAHLGAKVTIAQRDHMLARFERSRLKIEHATGRRASAEEQRALREGLNA